MTEKEKLAEKLLTVYRDGFEHGYQEWINKFSIIFTDFLILEKKDIDPEQFFKDFLTFINKHKR